MSRFTVLVLAICVCAFSSLAEAQRFRCVRRSISVCCDTRPICLPAPSPTSVSQGLTDYVAASEAVDVSKRLVGTWKLQKAKNAGSPSGIGTRLKMFTGTHWCIIQPDPDTGEIVFQHGGTYQFDGTMLQEKIQFAGASTSSLIGRTFTHKLEFTGDALKQMDPEGVFNETWHREKQHEPRE